MSMRDEPWDQLQKRSRPRAAFRTLTLEQARDRFGELQETLTDGIVPATVYRTFEGEGGAWKPVFDQMKRCTGYRLSVQR